MVDQTTSNETKKKMKTPTPFNGKRENLKKFLQEVKIYLMANAKVYPDDIDKILFVIAYMSEGDAHSWREEFIDTSEQVAAQNQTNLTFGTYTDFITKITTDFSPFDAPKDAIYEMKELRKGGDTTIEEHVSKFKILVNKSKLSKNDAVVEYFRESLPVPLQKEIMKLPDVPATLDDWYKWAIKLHNNHIRMKSAIAKTQGKGTANTNSASKTTDKKPRKFYFEPKPHDPDAMLIDYMSTDERNELMKKGACFNCKKVGHLSKNCPDKKKYVPPQTNTSQKMKGKELTAHIRTLLAQMDEDDKEEFFKDAVEEGF